MNLRNVDLNLLVVLDALLETRSVSRAGERIGLSQPAMSAALGRLRELFRDALLVRVGRNYTLTEGAEQLIVPVREILNRIEHTIQERPRFDPRTDTRSFSISASDYATLVLIVPFVRAVVAEAPGITINLLPPLSRRGGSAAGRSSGYRHRTARTLLRSAISRATDVQRSMAVCDRCEESPLAQRQAEPGKLYAAAASGVRHRRRSATQSRGSAPGGDGRSPTH
jgi:DNA-binding transcriptional LysR family regulator